MLPDPVSDDTQGLIAEAKEAIVRFSDDLSRFYHLVGREETARFGKDLALFNQLLALLGEHMRSMQERIDRTHRLDREGTAR
jgi:hypothetical protein